MTGRVSSPSAIHFRHQNSCLRKAIWVRHWALTSKSPALRAWQYSRVSSARKMTAYIASTHQPVAVQLIMGLRGSPNDFSSRLNSVRTRSSASHRTSRRRKLVWSGQCPRLLANATKRPVFRWAAITAETFGVTNRDKVAHRASERASRIFLQFRVFRIASPGYSMIRQVCGRCYGARCGLFPHCSGCAKPFTADPLRRSALDF